MVDKDNVRADLKGFCLKTAEILSAMLKEVANSNKGNGQNAPRLIFPQYRASESDDIRVRVSEQEARFAFCQILNKQHDYYYAVECPTKEMYRFTGSQHERSGNTDLCLFDLNLTRVAGIEFKAHMVSDDSFKKDIEKLVKENLCGCWFHLLKSKNKGTLPVLFCHLLQAFSEVADELRGTKRAWKQRTILIAVCVLSEEQQPPSSETWGNPCILELSGCSPQDFRENFEEQLMQWERLLL